jgi:hypothetical protein
LAIVGGALAFKAKFNEPYCTAQVNQNPQINDGLCTFNVQGVKKFCPAISPAEVAGIVSFCYTKDEDGNFDCSTFAGGIFTTLRCTTTPEDLENDQ